ncbi:carbon-nitrogen family hydrolase [Marinococcus luteus]|uniref:carbon-nitrogen family hydrolase n=1 Tax=Marinococcus luteus TaxID=1122204 RepID=UPI002ACC8459|nr:carbon-nitrogen family hydrolase [Marinococcus luteus]MDZ5784195.1 carbon-nitrogen family hydrolase [Marinococcus luteus]
MNIAVYQMDIVAGEPELNREKVRRWLREQELGEVDLLMLPEMWTTAYTLPELGEIAEDPADSETIRFLQNAAVHYQVHIMGGSIAVKENRKVYNRAIVIDNRGEVIYEYDKMHLVPMLNEPAYLSGGREPVKVFELGGVKMGVVICYDLRFPEIIRSLALQGCELLFIPAEWPDSRRSHWDVLSVARAVENQMYVVTCNRPGSYDGITFAGSSAFIDPWGNLLQKGSVDREETLRETLDLSNVAEVRKNVPVFDSRVPELYE